MFQTFRRYEPGWRTNPIASILSEASTQKIPRNMFSVLSWKWDRVIRFEFRCGTWAERTKLTVSTVLSVLGRCSSRARTMQLAIMVRRTAYSKGGHSIMNRVNRRSVFSSERTKRDVGPACVPFPPPAFPPAVPPFRDPMAGRPKGREAPTHCSHQIDSRLLQNDSQLLLPLQLPPYTKLEEIRLMFPKLKGSLSAVRVDSEAGLKTRNVWGQDKSDVNQDLISCQLVFLGPNPTFPPTIPLVGKNGQLSWKNNEPGAWEIKDGSLPHIDSSPKTPTIPRT